MEQYWMPKELDFENLRKCLDNYTCTSINIRQLGVMGGLVKVNEKLDGRVLDFEKGESGLGILIDSSQVFHFPLLDYTKGFSLAYERITPRADGIGRMVMLSGGVDPYASNLPEPCKSVLRIDLDRHLMEIEFKGRIDLKFHSQKLPWTYWVVGKANDVSDAIQKQEIEYSEDS